MARASYAQGSFLGGEWSQTARGNIADPHYKISMSVCFNGFPMQPGAWTRRPGTACAGFTRKGQAGRVQEFDFEEASPYILESTNGYIRFWCSEGAGLTRVTTNDSVAASAISTANPASVTLSAAVTWVTGDTGFFTNLGTVDPLLLNRTFVLTKTDTTHFTLADELTGTTLDGSTLKTFTTGTLNHVHEVTAPHIGTTWQSNRLVQTEEIGVMLNGAYTPQALITTAPAAGGFTQFAIAAANFQDGPYLDAFKNGVQVTPNQTSGLIQLALGFQQFSPTVSYSKGAFITSSSVNYQSLIDQNLATQSTVTFTGSSAVITGTNTFAATNKVVFFSVGGTLPVALTQGQVYFVIATGLSGSQFEVSATSGGGAITMAAAGTGTMSVMLAPAQLTSNWSTVNASAAVNNGQGFLASDVGRLVRLFSEPALWQFGSVYTSGTVVAYNPTGTPGAATYWQSLTSSNTGKTPGADNTNWQLVAPGAVLPSVNSLAATSTQSAGPAQWTYGKIASLLNFIAGSPSGIARIGNMTSGGGLAAAFNGVTVQNGASSPTITGSATSSQTLTVNAFVGQNYSGCSPSSYGLQSATVFPTSDLGFAQFQQYASGGSYPVAITYTLTAQLYGSNTTPSSYNSGTLLGTTSIAQQTVPQLEASGALQTIGNQAITIQSNSSTAYSYVWVVITATFNSNFGTLGYPWSSANLSVQAAQVEFVSAAGAGASANGVNVELLGPALLYTSAIISWRLGAYSGTTGYPTCGTYSDGRLWLSGAIVNRIDACYANGISLTSPGVINFAPTDQYGNVTAANAISYTFNAPGANPIFWMEPDLQGILAGTQAGEWLIVAPAAGGLSPLNISARRVTKIRCANIEPRRTEHTLVLVQTFQRKIVEYFSDVFSGKFSAPDLTEKFKHMTVGNVAELAYQQELVPIVWVRLATGGFFGMTYKRDTLMTSSGPTFVAGHRHALGSGFSVGSICAGPSADGNLDALVMVTSDGTYSRIEQLTDIFEEAAAVTTAQFLDCAITNVSYTTALTSSGQNSVVISGLWPLNGQTCTAFLGGLDAGDWPVANGQMVVDLAPGTGQSNAAFTAAFVSGFSGAMPVVIGFTYESDGQILKHYEPQEAGTRTGPAVGNIGRTHKFAAQVVNTQGVSFGSTFTGVNSKFHPLIFTNKGGNVVAASNSLQTGVFASELDDEYDRENTVAWKITRPWPCTVGLISGKTQNADI